MTKKISLIIAMTILFTVIAGNVKAECDGFYIAGRAGYAEYEMEDDRSNVSNSVSDYVVDKKRFIASGALGYRHKHFRGELEYVWRKSNSDTISGFTDGKFKSHSYMFVVYYDFFPYSWFTPFVNAGIGYSRTKLSLYNRTVDVGHKIKENGFTWSLGAGLSAKLTNRWNLDIGYRYYDMGELSVYNGDTTVDNQEIYLGLRYVL